MLGGLKKRLANWPNAQPFDENYAKIYEYFYNKTLTVSSTTVVLGCAFSRISYRSYM
jgi:hypothetical protein